MVFVFIVVVGPNGDNVKIVISTKDAVTRESFENKCPLQTHCHFMFLG